jgi:hypothetical protein
MIATTTAILAKKIMEKIEYFELMREGSFRRRMKTIKPTIKFPKTAKRRKT